MQTLFDSQEFTPTDVERFGMEEQQLQNQIDTLEKDIAQVDEELWNDEMSIGKLQDKVSNFYSNLLFIPSYQHDIYSLFGVSDFLLIVNQYFLPFKCYSFK